MKLHTVTVEIVRNDKHFKVKATQRLGEFDIGHYAGYVEQVENKTVVGVFQSTNSPKEKITIETLHEEFSHLFRHEEDNES